MFHHPYVFYFDVNGKASVIIQIGAYTRLYLVLFPELYFLASVGDHAIGYDRDGGVPFEFGPLCGTKISRGVFKVFLTSSPTVFGWSSQLSPWTRPSPQPRRATPD